MKVWPSGKRGRSARRGLARRRARRPETPAPDLAHWVLHDENLLVETRFGGNAELYAAWRDRLWTEMHDTIRRPERVRHFTEDEEYVVQAVFEGDRAQYRVCRDRLREELWQIMKITRGS